MLTFVFKPSNLSLNTFSIDIRRNLHELGVLQIMLYRYKYKYYFV